MLVFHPSVEPYRVDFFNDLNANYNFKMYLYYEYLKDVDSKYEKIEKELNFKPHYFKRVIYLFGRNIPVGFIRYLIESQPDIVLVNEYSESLWLTYLYRLISRRKIKIVSICDDSVDIFKNEKGLHRLSRKMGTRFLDAVILCNDSVSELYHLKFPGLKTTVMPIIHKDDCYLQDYELIKDKAISYAQKNKLLGKRIYLFVGRISPEKNIEYLIKSFVQDHANHPENILYIVGGVSIDNNDYSVGIDTIIENNNAENYIIRLGRMDGNNLKEMYYLSQVLVLPSKREAFGAVTNEALLFGCYVMVSSRAGATCLVDNKNGEIIDINCEYIDFSSANVKIPLLSYEYLNHKTNKMKYSYKECISNLTKWIDKV